MENNLERWIMRIEFPAIASPCPTMKGDLAIRRIFSLVDMFAKP